MKEKDIIIKDVSWHRNGVSGEGFYSILFHYKPEKVDMVASLFDEAGYCAVYSIPELIKGNIAFANGNSWRGDEFEYILRPAVNNFLKTNKTNRLGPFSL
jgi:hypothetical protein